MSAWELLGVWFGGSVLFTPLIGYFLGLLTGRQTAAVNASVVQFPQPAPSRRTELRASRVTSLASLV